MDVHDRKTRSFNMSQIKSKNTKPEEIVRKFLFQKGYRYRKNVQTMPGRPDIVMPKYKTIIFVNGCFWHMHLGCKEAHIPISNNQYWEHKLHKNVVRDQENYRLLQKAGWRIIIVWECELNKRCRDERLNRLIKEIVD